MPTKRTKSGCYQYGSEGKTYCGAKAKEKAQRQGRAIEMSRHGVTPRKK